MAIGKESIKRAASVNNGSKEIKASEVEKAVKEVKAVKEEKALKEEKAVKAVKEEKAVKEVKAVKEEKAVKAEKTTEIEQKPIKKKVIEGSIAQKGVNAVEKPLVSAPKEIVSNIKSDLPIYLL